MSKLNDRQRDNCMKIFKYFDKNDGGTIDKRDLKAALQKLGNLSIFQIEAIIKEADVDDQCEAVDFNKFCGYIAPRLTKMPLSSHEMKTAFRIYDVIGDGLLGVDEVVRLANDLGFGSISGEQATSLISLVDDDGDGKINFEEFKRLVVKK